MLPQFNCIIGEFEKFGHFQCLLSLKVENLLRNLLVGDLLKSFYRVLNGYNLHEFRNIL